MKTVLETERLVVREWEPEDAGAAFAMCGDAEVMRYIGDGRPWADEARARAWIESMCRAYAERGWSRWAVVEKASGEVVGSCGYGLPYGTDELDFGYMFGRAHWGKGYATEAARACLRYGFEELGFEEIPASVDPRHLASICILEKLGFEYRGMRRFGDDDEDSAHYVATKPGGDEA